LPQDFIEVQMLREPPGEADERLAGTLIQMIWAAIYLDDPGFGQRRIAVTTTTGAIGRPEQTTSHPWDGATLF
jgi:hypothetical protein